MAPESVGKSLPTLGAPGHLRHKDRRQAMKDHRTMKVYLSGEIHTDWRDRIIEGAKGLDLSFAAPVTDHAASDDCGVEILGAEPDKFWHDRKGAQVNAIRTRHGIESADIVVVRFGEKYKQWNAAFDAGYAAALGKSLIILHPEEHDHALKEVDAAALAVARTPEQVVGVLRYVLTGTLG
jgi:YtoQ family protein